mmetsp:Transcript_1310/g.1667  ORF Transcript_1310/g.1667 Transcript_1310/m.1667 type:complete len:240 (+) Transcript_1310:533-1252(+)
MGLRILLPVDRQLQLTVVLEQFENGFHLYVVVECEIAVVVVLFIANVALSAHHVRRDIVLHLEVVQVVFKVVLASLSLEEEVVLLLQLLLGGLSRDDRQKVRDHGSDQFEDEQSYLPGHPRFLDDSEPRVPQLVRRVEEQVASPSLDLADFTEEVVRHIFVVAHLQFGERLPLEEDKLLLHLHSDDLLSLEELQVVLVVRSGEQGREPLGSGFVCELSFYYELAHFVTQLIHHQVVAGR